MNRSLITALAAATLAGATSTQLCPAPSDTFYKNDILADVPAGQITLSVIPGLCEGEAAGSVFDLPGSNQILTQVSIGFGSAGGAQGATALVNVEIYDGVSFVGKEAFLGAKVFDLEAQTGASLQVTSTGLNIFDMTQFGVEVGNNPNGNFVVASRMSFNPNGNCASGFTSNFVTDNTQPGIFGCDPGITPAQKNIIDITGEPNWQDCNAATVGGVQLCPFFYAGNWVIRACTENAGGAVCQPDLGFQGPGNATLSVCGQALNPGGTANLLLENANPSSVSLLFVALSNNPVPILGGTLVPIPWFLTEVFVTDGSGEVSIPGISSAAGPIDLFVQFLIVDPGETQGFEFSNALRLEFL